jgi:hypothetical protein
MSFGLNPCAHASFQKDTFVMFPTETDVAVRRAIDLLSCKGVPRPSKT